MTGDATPVTVDRTRETVVGLQFFVSTQACEALARLSELRVRLFDSGIRESVLCDIKETIQVSDTLLVEPKAT